MKYIPQSPTDRAELLKAVGLKTEDELFQFIPSHLKIKGALKYPKAQSEIEIRKTYQDICASSATPSVNFAGFGIYHHDIPSIVPYLQGRSEFSTSYTPYQPEISQGTLQAIFEFQTMVCQLTECELSNSSLYDGATALAEGVLMALRIKKKSEKKILISSALHPHFRQVLNTYLTSFADRMVDIPLSNDQTDLEFISKNLSSADIVVLQSPNVFGVLENFQALQKNMSGAAALVVTSTMEPFVWGITRGPGAFGAHIVTAEGQSFGAPPYLGGASYGIFATKSEYLRQLPGRLVGETVDEKGRRSYTLTFATREQFIRREKATSNICTNQNLNMLGGTIHLATLGKAGIRAVAVRCLSHAEYLKKNIRDLGKYKISNSPTFNEFVVETPKPAAEYLAAARDEGWVCGVDLGRFGEQWKHKLLICTTELHTKNDIDRQLSHLRKLM